MTATKPTFNLLSIGHRGVGKTVFLAGSYIELHGGDSQNQQKLWFECQDMQVQEQIANLLDYVSQSGHYPPPTMKVTNFSFKLKLRRLWGSETLCDFRWLDIPGEICSFQNAEFRSMVSNSDGCCVFIDAHALINNTNTYLQHLEEIVKQVTAIASLAYLHDCNYPFAIVLTKCDLLKTDRPETILELLLPLTSCLDAVKANYETFYSLIPIVRTPREATLKPTGAAAPMLWLVWQLSQTENFDLIQHHPELDNSLQTNVFQMFQNLMVKVLPGQQYEVSPAVKKQDTAHNLLPPTRSRSNLLVMAIAVASVGIVSLAFRYIKLTQFDSQEKITPATTSSKFSGSTESQTYKK